MKTCQKARATVDLSPAPSMINRIYLKYIADPIDGGIGVVNDLFCDLFRCLDRMPLEGCYTGTCGGQTVSNDRNGGGGDESNGAIACSYADTLQVIA